MNKAILKGNLVANPELKETQSGKHVVRIRIAVPRRGKNAGADFVDIVAWEHTADFICQYFSKGQAILVEGRIQTRAYEKDGQKRSATEVVVETVDFAGGAKATEQAQTATQSQPVATAPAPTVPNIPAPPSATVADDDIPF